MTDDEEDLRRYSEMMTLLTKLGILVAVLVGFSLYTLFT